MTSRAIVQTLPHGPEDYYHPFYDLQEFEKRRDHENAWRFHKSGERAEFLSKKYGHAAYIIERITTKRWRLLSLSVTGFGNGNQFLYDNMYPATADLTSFAEAHEWMRSEIERRDRNLSKFHIIRRESRTYDYRGKLKGKTP